MPDRDKDSGRTGEARSPPFRKDTRNRDSVSLPPSRGPLIGAPDTAVSRRSHSTPTPSQPEGSPQRRRGDAGAMPANRSPRARAVVAGPIRKEPNPWRVVASVTGMIAVALLCALLWPAARNAMEDTTPAAAAIPNPSASVKPETRGGKERVELPADAGVALTMALDHLDAALVRASGKSPQELLHKISLPGQNCPMVWANDSPSLVFGGAPIRPNSLAHILEDCAEAVSRVQ
jgi:hypothetical protein